MHSTFGWELYHWALLLEKSINIDLHHDTILKKTLFNESANQLLLLLMPSLQRSEKPSFWHILVYVVIPEFSHNPIIFMVLATDDPKEKLVILSTSIGINPVCWWDINGLANSSLHSPTWFKVHDRNINSCNRHHGTLLQEPCLAYRGEKAWIK